MSVGSSHLNLDLNFLEDTSNSESLTQVDTTVRPWVRFAARFIDTYIFALLLGLFFSSAMPKSEIVFGFVSLFLWIFVESVLLSSWGTTFGKWLLMVKIADINGHKLTFSIALQRSFLVWFKGIGF